MTPSYIKNWSHAEMHFFGVEKIRQWVEINSKAGFFQTFAFSRHLDEHSYKKNGLKASSLKRRAWKYGLSFEKYFNAWITTAK